MTISTDQRHEEFQKLWKDYALADLRPGVTFSDRVTTIHALVVRWLETGDPIFVDHAVIFCADHDIPIQPSLLQHIADAARLRKKNVNADTPRPERETQKAKAFQVMMNLVIRGVTVERASEVAAVWLADRGMRKMKASSLYKEYRRSGFYTMRFLYENFILECPDPESDEAWLNFEKNCRAITTEEKGEK